MKIESDSLLVLSDSYEKVNTAASSSQYANISTIHVMTVSLENSATSLENSATSLENSTISLENSVISLENNAVHYITTVTKKVPAQCG